MFGSSLIRGLYLSGVVIVSLAGAAHAGGNSAEPPPADEPNYSGPAIIRKIPGLRILFGDDALTEEEYNQLYEKKNKKKQQIDESYYEPKPAQPAKPKVVKPTTAPASTTPTAAAPATPKQATNPALPQKTAAATPAKPLAAGPLSCEKATEVVAGYGFSSVEASACSGKLYAFNAKRGGKNFAIKFDPVSGQLTEVKKLP